MKPEEQRIAIAEACGWTNITWLRLHAGNEDYWGSGCIGADEYATRHRIPYYLTDLNAMHEAEMGIDDFSRDKYRRTLGGICQTTHEIWHATAAQRAEAFLKTLNLWKEQ